MGPVSRNRMGEGLTCTDVKVREVRGWRRESSVRKMLAVQVGCPTAPPEPAIGLERAGALGFAGQSS